MYKCYLILLPLYVRKFKYNIDFQMLDTLLHTLIREQQNETIPGRIERAREVARRFVRSVARIFVIFSVEMAPGAAKKKG